YVDYSKTTVIPLIKRYPNIVVVRTLSKAFGLPSLRIGYVIASERYIHELLKVRGPYDINMIAYTASLAAFNDIKAIQKYTTEVMDQAKPMVEEFFTRNNITFYHSAANFLLYNPLIEKEAEILKKNGILVRPQDKTNIEGTLRLTIGTTEQMKKFITVYQNVILNTFKKKKYAFIDRDGTLIFEPIDTFQIDSIKKLKILRGVIKGLKKLIEQEYHLIMVTNQDGLGTPSFSKADFDAPQNTLITMLQDNGITFEKIYICPHLPTQNCGCRKPKTGLVKNFLKENQMDKGTSFVCGDRPTDKAFANNLGITFVSMQTNGDFYEALEKGGISL
ncbi:MAG TPA: histidinol-phosphatase, partial [Patescibacteria group bacterium]